MHSCVIVSNANMRCTEDLFMTNRKNLSFSAGSLFPELYKSLFPILK